jgi:transcriptional regulator with XRE-family HTH domain
MQQPELGRQLTALRKEKNLTQEELVGKSYVSVRTIQRIEAGEVLPRVSTVKILLAALGQNPEQFLTKYTHTMETKTNSTASVRNIVLTAVIAGAIYLVAEVILIAMNIAWFTGGRDWEQWMNLIYAGVTVVMVASYVLFVRGFITLSNVFENALLKVGSYLMMAAIAGLGILDISSLGTDDIESLAIPYSAAAILGGALSIVFGVGLMRLQDGMGELSRIAGILEILFGCTLITVLLFFISYVIMVPAVIVEILVLYRGYEYLSRSEVASTVRDNQASSASA